MQFKKLGLVLAGGGGKGAYQIGVWKALREFGLDVQVQAVSGTSVGALNGAMFVQDKYEQAEHMWLNIESRNMLSLNSNPQLLSLAQNLTSIGIVPPPMLGVLKTRGIYSQEGLQSMIRDGLDANLLIKAPRSLTLALHDMESNEVVYQQVNEADSAGKMLLATAALPGIFDPVRISGTVYSDGGFYWGLPHKKLDNTPVQPLVEAGCDTVIVVCLSQDDLSVTPQQYPGIKLLPIVSTAGYGSLTASLDFSNEGARWRMDQGYGDAVNIFRHLQLFLDNEEKYDELWQRAKSSSSQQESKTHTALQQQDQAHTELVSKTREFDSTIRNDDFSSQMNVAEDDSVASLALQDFALENSKLLNDLERVKIEEDVKRFVVQNQNNRSALEAAAFDAVAALAPVNGRANGLRDQNTLSRLWNSLTGINQKIAAENDHALAQAQFAALRLIAAVQEKGAVTLEFVCALQNRLNGAYQEIAHLTGRHNQDVARIYHSMASSYVKLRNELVSQRQRIDKLERRQAINEWLDHPDIPCWNGLSYKQLDPHLRLARLINEFYCLTEGNWNARELNTLQQMCNNLSLGSEVKLNMSDFCTHLAQDREHGRALVGGLVKVVNENATANLPASQWLNRLREQQLDPQRSRQEVISSWGYAEQQTTDPCSLAFDILYHMQAAGLSVQIAGTLVEEKTRWLKSLEVLDDLVNDKILTPAFRNEITPLKDQIKRFKLSIPLIGKFSSGKSTLLNAWLGAEIQPYDLGPCTGLATEFHYTNGQEECVIVSSAPDHPLPKRRESIPLSHYAERVKKLNPEKDGTEYIELHLNRPAMAYHPDLVVVDTPGIGSTVSHHEKALERYLGESSAYVLCVHAKTFVGEEERLFLLRQRSLGQSTSVLVCQEDLVIAANRASIRQIVSEQTGIALKDVYGCSANPLAIDLTGFNDLLAHFEQSKDRLFQQRFSGAVTQLLASAKANLQQQLAADSHAGELDAKMEGLEKKQKQLSATLEDEKSHLRTRCTMLSEQIISMMSSFMRSRRNSYVSMIKGKQDIGPMLTADFKSSFQLAVEQVLKPEFKKIGERLGEAAALDSADIAMFSTSASLEGSEGGLGSLAAAGAGWVVAGPVGAILAGVIAWLCSRNNADEEANEQVLQAIESAIQQMRTCVPGVVTDIANKYLKKIGDQVENKLKKSSEQIEQLKDQLRQDVDKRKEIKAKAEKALDTVKKLLLPLHKSEVE